MRRLTLAFLVAAAAGTCSPLIAQFPMPSITPPATGEG